MWRHQQTREVADSLSWHPAPRCVLAITRLRALVLGAAAQESRQGCDAAWIPSWGPRHRRISGAAWAVGVFGVPSGLSYTRPRLKCTKEGSIAQFHCQPWSRMLKLLGTLRTRARISHPAFRRSLRNEGRSGISKDRLSLPAPSHLLCTTRSH